MSTPFLENILSGMVDAQHRARRIAAYILAVALPVAFLLTRMGMADFFGERPLMIFYMFPIIVSSLLGGVGPGLITTTVVTLSTAYFFIPPIGSFSITAGNNLVHWSMLVTNGVLVSFLSEFLHRSLRRETARLRQLTVTRDELKKSEARFQATFEQAAVGIAQVAPSGDWLRLNSKLLDIVGYGQEELLSLPFSGIIHPDDREKNLEYIRRMLARDLDAFSSENRFIRKDGGIVWVNLTVSLTWDPNDDPDYFIFVIEDIQARKQAEEKINCQYNTLEAINRVLKETFSCGTFEELGCVCLNIAERLTGSRFGFIGEVGEDGLLHVIAISNPGWELCSIYDREKGARPPVDLQIRGIYGRVLTEGKGFFTNDPPSHPDSIGTPEGHPPLTAFLGVPLHQDGRVFGMIAVGNGERGYGEEELESLEALAPAIMESFQRKRTEEAIKSLNEELEERVRERTARLEEVNRELEAFSYSVSHDLKAPLRGIDGYSRLLEEDYLERLDDEGRLFIRNIRSSTAKMHELIEDLLNYSRMERRSLSNVSLDLPALVKSVVAEGAEEIERGGIHLRLELPPLTVKADREGLALVLRNLLENAFKFSRDSHPPEVEIGARREGEKAVLWVRDNGIGFDMKFHDRIFEIFQCLQRIEDFPGTGIGLALVRKAMQRMGGRAWAESAPGEGATFLLEIPI